MKFDPSQFRQEMWWGFHNFSTADLSWDTFAQTFSDVQESDIHWEHPFDWLFYTSVYEGFASGGNCFGVSIESVYAQVGKSLFGEPIVSYPANATDMQEINIKMGYPLGGAFIDWFLGEFVSGAVRNPINTFNVSRDQFNRGDLPVISIATNEWGGDGHCVRPYKWYDADYPGKPGKLVVAVANPNSPGVPYSYEGGNYRAVPDNDSSCLIVIDKAINTYELSAAQGSRPSIRAAPEAEGFAFRSRSTSRRVAADPVLGGARAPGRRNAHHLRRRRRHAADHRRLRANLLRAGLIKTAVEVRRRSQGREAAHPQYGAHSLSGGGARGRIQ
jgi:hypothetical protein